MNSKWIIVIIILILTLLSTLALYAKPQLSNPNEKIEMVHLYKNLQNASEFIFKKSFTETYNIKFNYLKWVPIVSDNIKDVKYCDTSPKLNIECTNNRNHVVVNGSIKNVNLTITGFSDTFKNDEFLFDRSNSTYNFNKISINNPFNNTLAFTSESYGTNDMIYLDGHNNCKLTNIFPKLLCDKLICEVEQSKWDTVVDAIDFTIVDNNYKPFNNRILLFNNSTLFINTLTLPPFYNFSMEFYFNCTNS